MCRMISVGNRDLQHSWQIPSVLEWLFLCRMFHMEHPCSFTSGTQAWVHFLPSTFLEAFEIWEDKWVVFFEGVVAGEFRGGSFCASWGLVPWLLGWASEDIYKWGRAMWRKSSKFSGEFQNEYHVSVCLDLVCFLFQVLVFIQCLIPHDRNSFASMWVIETQRFVLIPCYEIAANEFWSS